MKNAKKKIYNVTLRLSAQKLTDQVGNKAWNTNVLELSCGSLRLRHTLKQLHVRSPPSLSLSLSLARAHTHTHTHAQRNSQSKHVYLSENASYSDNSE